MRVLSFRSLEIECEGYIWKHVVPDFPALLETSGCFCWNVRMFILKCRDVLGEGPEKVTPSRRFSERGGGIH